MQLIQHSDADIGQGLKLFNRYLQKDLGEVIERYYPKNIYSSGEVIPTAMDIDIYDETLLLYSLQEYGQASDVDEGLDLNIVEVSGREIPFQLYTKGSKVLYSWKDAGTVQKAMSNGYSLPSQLHARKLQAPMKVLSNAANVLAAFGRPGVPGFVNDPDVPVTTSTFDPYPVTVTAHELIRFISDALLDIETSNIVEGESDLGRMMVIAPRSLCIKLKQTYLDGTSVTAEQALLANHPNIVGLLPTSYLRSAELEARGIKNVGDNENRFIIYPFDDQCLERHESMVVPLPAEYRDGRFHIPFVQSFSQTIWKQPLFARYVDFANNPAVDS